ncbi:MAG: hypothetical protein FJX76_27725 [Armatimonadetes bacterium]|nr:hypothetical protein [Armatimonadota bacterium]
MTIKVDLLPSEKKGFGIDPVMIFLVLIIILFTAGFFVYGKSLETNIARKEEDVRQIDVKIQDVRSKLPGIQKMKDENAKIEAQITTIKGLKNDPVRYANLLWELAEALPSNIFVANINVEPAQQSVVFSGSSVTTGTMKPLESIALMMRNLQTSRYFKDATLSAVTQSKGSDGVVGFNFQIETHYDQDAALKAPDQIAPPSAPAAPGASSEVTPPETTPPAGEQPGAAPASPAAGAEASPAASPAAGEKKG